MNGIEKIDIYEGIPVESLHSDGRMQQPILEINECLNGTKGKDIQKLTLNYLKLRKSLLNNSNSYTEKKTYDLLADLQARSKQYIVDVHSSIEIRRTVPNSKWNSSRVWYLTYIEKIKELIQPHPPIDSAFNLDYAAHKSVQDLQSKVDFKEVMELSD